MAYTNSSTRIISKLANSTKVSRRSYFTAPPFSSWPNQNFGLQGPAPFVTPVAVPVPVPVPLYSHPGQGIGIGSWGTQNGNLIGLGGGQTSTLGNGFAPIKSESDKSMQRFYDTLDAERDKRVGGGGPAPWVWWRDQAWAPNQSHNGQNWNQGYGHHSERLNSRIMITRMLIGLKQANKISFEKLANAINRSEMWTASALFGQHPFSKNEAEKIVEVLGVPKHMNERIVLLLQEAPLRGSVLMDVPSDPTIYRLYEIMQVYGIPFKALLTEKVGDGIMSAVDCKIDVNTEGNRVRLTIDSAFEPYGSW